MAVAGRGHYEGSGMGRRKIKRVQRCYEECRQQLYTYALSIGHDGELAEDAIQSAFFNLLRRDRQPRSLKPYVFRCVRNAVIDGLRASQLRQGSTNDSPEPANGEEYVLRDRALSQCLEAVSPAERETIVLKIYGGLSFREIAKVQSLSTNTVASRYRRGLEKMRKRLGGQP